MMFQRVTDEVAAGKADVQISNKRGAKADYCPHAGKRRFG